MTGYLKILHISTVFTVLLTCQQSTSTTLTEVLVPDINLEPDSSINRSPRDTRDSREKYPQYVNDNTDKTLKPEDSSDRDAASSPLGKRCISCVSSVLDRYPYNDRNRYYDDYNRRDYDRYDDRDRYYDRDRYFDRYDRYPDRNPIFRGRDRYGDRDRYYDPYDSDRGYEPYDRYDRYGGRDRTYYDPYDRYNDRGIGYDNRGYDYRGYDNRYDTHPYRSNDDTFRGYSPGGRDYGTSGYASKWNYGNSGGGRDDYYNRDRYPAYRPVSKDPVRDPIRDPTRDPVRDPYNDTYRPTSYLYGRPSSTTIKPPNAEESNTQASQGSSG